MKSVLKTLTKKNLRLTAAAATTDEAIYKKIFRSGVTTLIILNEIMRIVKSRQESGLLIKGVSETIKNEAKEQKRGFLSLLLGTLGARLLGNVLTGKGRIIRSPHPLTNFEIQKYYQNEPKLNDVDSRNNLLKLKDGAYVIKLDGDKSIGAQ